MIYLDNNATTPLAPEVLDAMMPYFSKHFGNPASRQHAFGWVAQEAVDQARQQVADALHVDPAEILFTSGATEACNLALKGIFDMYVRKGRHVIAIATEHKAVLDTCQYLETQGAEVTILPVDAQGHVDLEKLRDEISLDTIAVAAMWANNETGVMHPIAEIGKICAEKGTLFFTDATQAVGKIDVHPRDHCIQVMAFSAHKFHGPKGIGVLYVSRKSPRVKLVPLIHGGGHEEGMRSGTLNVPGIVGLGKALSLAQVDMPGTEQRLRALRDHFEAELHKLPAVHVNGDIVHRMGHVSNIRFEGIDSAALMSSLSKELAMAAGSACTSANPEPSHVLQAMGLSREEAKSSVRISLGNQTTSAEIDQAIALITGAVQKLREESVEWRMKAVS